MPGFLGFTNLRLILGRGQPSHQELSCPPMSFKRSVPFPLLSFLFSIKDKGYISLNANKVIQTLPKLSRGLEQILFQQSNPYLLSPYWQDLLPQLRTPRSQVTERIVLKTEPAETLQEESEKSASTPSQVSTNLLIARPPRARPPAPTFQGVKRKDSPVRPVKESEKNRREELLKKALIGSTLDNLVSSPRLATVSRNNSGRAIPCTVQSQLSLSGVTSPTGISAQSNLNNHKN